MSSRSGKQQNRKHLVMTIQFSSEETSEENVRMAEEWKYLIKLESLRVIKRDFHSADDSSATSKNQ